MHLKHGHTIGRVPSRTYSSWQTMIWRCTNPKSDNYRNYGGRGIAVCPQWLDFRGFLADMGIRPEGMTLDRINSDGNYEPSNCRWATAKQQANNRRDAWHGGPAGRRRVVDREKCKRGHVYAEVGVYVYGKQTPACKACARENRRAYVLRQRQAALGAENPGKTPVLAGNL